MIPTVIRRDTPFPIPRSVIRSPSHIAKITGTLHEGNGNRERTSNLAKFLTARFAFLTLQTLEVRNRKTKQLYDDTRRDVRHNTQGHDRGLVKGTPGKEVNQTEEVITTTLSFKRFRQLIHVGTRKRDIGTQTVNSDQEERKQDPLTQFPTYFLAFEKTSS